MATPATIIDRNLPVVALVGRVNVGKSTLFNRMTASEKALVSKIPGTTRTRNIGMVNWRGKNIQLVDTGGLTFADDVLLEDEIIRQTELALKEADLVLFVTDIQTGILPQERELAKRLMKQKDKVILVANKADSQKWSSAIYNKEWLQLGFGQPAPVSAASGSGIGDLLDYIYRKLGKASRRPKKAESFQPIKVALLGKPNVGKSTLFNDLIGKEQVIVSDMPHTTREPHDTLVVVDRQPMLFIDTAGIRRKAKVSGELERAGISRSIAAVKKADIVLLILDASESISSQDQQLAGLLHESSKSVIIVVNKWDLAEENTDEFRNDVKADIYAAFPHLNFAPVVFVSAKTHYRVHQIFPLITQAWQGRNIFISDDQLAEFLARATREHRPARGKGTRHPKLVGFHQLRTNPPIFEMMIQAKTSVHISYIHYLENKLRQQFGFFATPIVIKLSKLKRNI